MLSICLLLLAGCADPTSGESQGESEGAATRVSQEEVTEAAATAATEVTTEAVAETTTEAAAETTTEAVAEATTEGKKETEYKKGTYVVNVSADGGSLECIFKDGELYQETFDGVFDPWGGKDSNGYYNSIADSPRYGMIIEEIVELYENVGYKVSVEEQ